jgi:molybdopterin-guanine dinucleotide biosynthesis protein
MMPFKIISVTGAHSSVGKTTLCSILLNNLSGFGAIKCTKTPLFTSVIDDQEVILQEDKDTAIMSRSGAEKVVWIKSSGSELEDALDLAMGKMNGLNGVVVEGNSPSRFLSPDLTIFIIGEEGQIKPAARKISEKADITIINCSQNTGSPHVLNHLSTSHGETFRINLIKKQGEIDKFLSYAKKYITG